MGRVSAEEWLQCSDSGPGGRDSTGLSLFHPLVLHSGRGGRAWEGRETSFGRRAKAAVSPPQNRHNISQCPYRDPWMGKTSAPPHNVGRGGGAGLKIWILETWVSSCWLTVNLGKSIPLSVFQL